MTADLVSLTRRINNEVILAMGVRVQGGLGSALQRVLAPATSRFSALFLEADRIVGDEGLIAGARWLLSRLVRNVLARGAESIPCEGPLIITSNHPGTVDSVCLAASARREDLRIIASDVPFLAGLHHISQHLIFLPRANLQRRMLAAREALRHLRAGGALLLFASGTIDPDPAFMRNAELELKGWSRSLELFVRDVPNACIVTSIVSHVIEPAFMRHPLTLLRHTRTDKQRLAMMLQVIQQMLGRRIEISPHVSFSPAVSGAMLTTHEQVLGALIEGARSLMGSHRVWQP